MGSRQLWHGRHPLDPEAVASITQALDVLPEVPAYSLEVTEVGTLLGAIDVAVGEVQVITCQDPPTRSSYHAPSRLGRLRGGAFREPAPRSCTCAPS